MTEGDPINNPEPISVEEYKQKRLVQFLVDRGETLEGIDAFKKNVQKLVLDVREGRLPEFPEPKPRE